MSESVTNHECGCVSSALPQLLGLSRLHKEVYDRSVDVQGVRLRKKIQPDKDSVELIRTERGAGYVFTAPVEIVR